MARLRPRDGYLIDLTCRAGQAIDPARWSARQCQEQRGISNRSSKRSGAKRSGAKRSGATIIEFAIVLPLLLFLLLGMIEMGRYVRVVVAVSNAARNGATYASASATAANDGAAIREAVLDELSSLETSVSNPVVTTRMGQDARSYSFVTVTVNYRFSPLCPLPGLPAQWQARRSIQMRILS